MNIVPTKAPHYQVLVINEPALHDAFHSLGDDDKQRLGMKINMYFVDGVCSSDETPVDKLVEKLTATLSRMLYEAYDSTLEQVSILSVRLVHDTGLLVYVAKLLLSTNHRGNEYVVVSDTPTRLR